MPEWAASDHDQPQLMPKTALHHASANGFLPGVVKLLREGQSTGCWDKDGWTPLHYACRNNHYDVTTALIRSGADVNAQNKVCTHF